jgi:hypothetical protein
MKLPERQSRVVVVCFESVAGIVAAVKGVLNSWYM